MDIKFEEENLSCRICLDTTKDAIDMTAAFIKANWWNELEKKFPGNRFSEAVTYLDCFQLCTNINLPNNEHILMVLCKDCAKNLISAFERMYKAEYSENILQDLSVKFQNLSSNLLNEEEFDKKKTKNVKFLCSNCFNSFPSKMELDDHFIYKFCRKSDIFRVIEDIEFLGLTFQTKSPSPFEDIDMEKVDMPESPEPIQKQLVDASKENSSDNKASMTKKTKNKKGNDNERPTFECDQCGKIYFHERSMLIHKRIHTGDTIPCKVCGKGFVNSRELSVHMRFHNRDYPFVCELCGLKYACMGHLRTHLWKHQGLKFQCEECDKLFGSLKGLNEHRILHTGSMPFPCSYCDRGYPSKHKYKMHLKTVHKVDPTTDEIIRSQKSSKLPRKRLRHTPKLVEVKQ